MLRLDTTTRKLQIVLGAAVAANQLPVVVSYSDKSTSSYIGSTQRSLTNGATAVDICAAPAASTIRDIDMLTVVNTDTADAAVRLLLDDNGTDAELFTVTLAPGSQINYTHGQGFKVIDKNGAPQADRQVFQLSAGAAIAEDDAIEIGPEGKAYPVVTTDYAAVTNCNYGTAQTSTATGRIFAQTQVHNADAHQDIRLAVAQGDDGSIFCASAYSGSQGLKLTKYSAAGGLLGTITLSSAGTNFTAQQVSVLSNGNILVGAMKGSGDVQFAILSPGLETVASLTTVSAAYSPSGIPAFLALSGGGFAVIYQPSTGGGLDTEIATYSDTGAVVQAATVIWTRSSGSVGYPMYAAAQLSNGNIAIAAGMIGVGSGSYTGQFHGVVTTAGASVLAFAQIDSTVTSISYSPQVAVLAGYYAVFFGNGTDIKAYVYNNSGTLQGAQFSATSSQGSYPYGKLVADVGNTCFWAIYAVTTGTKEMCAKIPVTGTGYTSIDVTMATTQYNHGIDAFCENGLIIALSNMGSAVAPVLFAINTASGSLVNSAGTTVGTAPTSGGLFIRAISGGDCAFVLFYNYGNSASQNLVAGKYANTSVVGMAAASAVQGDPVSIKQNAGTYVCNTLKGTASVAFDHTSGSNIYGNKGALLTNGVVLRGM